MQEKDGWKRVRATVPDYRIINRAIRKARANKKHRKHSKIYVRGAHYEYLFEKVAGMKSIIYRRRLVHYKNTNRKRRLIKIGITLVILLVIGIYLYSGTVDNKNTVNNTFVDYIENSSIKDYISIDNTSIIEIWEESIVNIIEDIVLIDTQRESLNTTPKLQNYPYSLNSNRKSLSFTTYGGLDEYLAKEDHSYYSNYEKEVIMELLENEYQDEYLIPFIKEIQSLSNSPDVQAKIAISLVQHIPYNWQALYSFSMDWYYPYETLHRNIGVCGDKSLLLVYLLDKLGYDVVLFEWDEHLAVGIRCNDRFDFENTGYAFIETTRPTIITIIPEEYIGGIHLSSSPNIIYVNKGGKSLNVEQEYNDAQLFKKIERMGEVLDEMHYAIWMRISNKYDLLYEV